MGLFRTGYARAPSSTERIARAVVATGRPENLAVFRIATAAALLTSADFWDAPRWATLPPALRIAPTTSLALLAGLPISPSSVQAVFVVTSIAAALALIGLFTRPALAVAAAGALFVLGVPQLFGQVTHDHHLLWFLALLAASPCGDALSVDAQRARTRPAPAPLAYALPLWFAWALVAVIFFFPGLWKLRASGLAWIESDNLRNQLWWKWAQGKFIPSLRLDRSPLLCRIAAASVIAFELSFAALVVTRRLRPFAACAAWLFHLATAIFLRVSFVSLSMTYVMFFDWRMFSRKRSRARVAPREIVCRRALPVAIVGSVLLAANVIQGARGAVDDWPFACYPTFQSLVPAEMPTLAAFAIKPDGSRVELALEPEEDAARQRAWSLTWSLMRAERRPQRLAAFWGAIAKRSAIVVGARDATTIHFIVRWISVDPDAPGVVREEPLGDVTP